MFKLSGEEETEEIFRLERESLIICGKFLPKKKHRLGTFMGDRLDVDRWGDKE